MKMAPYSPGRPIEHVQRETGLERIVKLASNENPFGPSPLAVEAMRRAASEANFYPDASGIELREALAARHGVSVSHIALGNGSDNLIQLIGHVMLDSHEDGVVVGSPSFVRYGSVAQLAGCRLVEVPATPDWALDTAAMARAVDAGTKAVFLANPNNPTGSYTSSEGVETLLAAVEGRGLLVLDEAYYEFARHLPDYPDAVSLVKQGRPVAVLRTFSKAFGLAGIRLGYLVGPEELVDAVDRAREPFNVNRIALAAALAALQDEAHVQRTVEGTQLSLSTIADRCQELGLDTLPSQANFVCVEVGGDDAAVARQLQERGVIVRPGSVLGMPGFLRVSAGTQEETSVFLDALEQIERSSLEPTL